MTLLTLAEILGVLLVIAGLAIWGAIREFKRSPVEISSQGRERVGWKSDIPPRNPMRPSRKHSSR